MTGIKRRGVKYIKPRLSGILGTTLRREHGSPVLNGQGELIGINFDRNWEGVGGDIQYLPDYQRSIIVDIRYVLFVIDK